MSRYEEVLNKLIVEFSLNEAGICSVDNMQQLCIDREWNFNTSYTRTNSNPYAVEIKAGGKTFKGLSNASFKVAWLRAYNRAKKTLHPKPKRERQDPF